MSTKNPKVTKATIAAEAVANWRANLEAKTDAETRVRAMHEARAARPWEGDVGRLRLAEAEIALLEAEDAERLARAEASAAVDADEFARGDALAIAASADEFRKLLGALVDDEARHRRGVEDARRAMVVLRQSSKSNLEQHRARRERDGLPPPAATIDFATADVATLAAVGTWKDNREKLAAKHREVTELRARLERSAREAHERDATNRKRGAEIAAEQRAVRNENDARNRAVVAQHEAARREDEELAEAHVAREQGAA